MTIKRRELRMTLSLTVVLVLLLCLLGSVMSLFSRQAYVASRNHSIQLEVEDVSRTTTAINTYFDHYVKDLRLLAGLPEVVEFISGGLSSRDGASSAEEHFANVLASRPEYYQVRIIDATGWEVVRVDQGRDGSIHVIPQDELQDKSGRYYVGDALKVDVGSLYSSPLDLNVEGGVIEVPYVPVFRVAMPLGGPAGEKLGILILNVYAQELFRLLGETMFLQTGEGVRFWESPGGEVHVEESTQVLEGTSGELRLGDNANLLLLYESIEPIPGCWLGVVKEIDVRPMRAAFILRTAGMVGTLLAGAILVFVATAIHFRRVHKITEVQSAMIDSLTILSTERDQESGRHLKRVKEYSMCLARTLANDPEFHAQMTPNFMEDLGLAAPLHDIGKVAIPDAVLLKPGKFDDAEWEIMREHSRIGASILKEAIEQHGLEDRYLKIAMNICAHHHERFDGTGYPYGLKGDEIPLEARIFAIVDAYDAIRSKRPYKDPLPHEEAMKRIRESAGTHFDPRIVAAFDECEKGVNRTSVDLAD